MKNKAKAKGTVTVPDDKDFERLGGMKWWKELHATHFGTNTHVSESPFAEFFGAVDRGLKLHIPPEGQERVQSKRKEQMAAQRKRCNEMRNLSGADASE